MTAPYWIDYGRVRFGLVAMRQPETCEMCGKAIRARNRCYRTKRWGPDQDLTIYMHQKCLIGQIDPRVWDIPEGGGR